MSIGTLSQSSAIAEVSYSDIYVMLIHYVYLYCLCRSRFGNMLTMAHLGSREMITQTFRNFEKRIRLECDAQPIPLPNLQGIVVLNIPSYSGGTDFWGTHSRGSSEVCHPALCVAFLSFFCFYFKKFRILPELLF